ncbi:MAG: hypothetical protein M1453_05100 [Acidobacteria bacterium]|nr:hypothetical protein [Acidobacteriota bacterium]
MARNQWGSMGVAIAAGVVCVLLLRTVLKTFSQNRANWDATYRKKLAARLVFFSVVFIATGALVGFQIGTSGAETNQLIADLHKMSQLGDRISDARNAAARNVPSQIAMYQAIEADVQEFSVVLARLRTEVGTYDRKYPSQRETNSETIKSIEIGLKRAELLRKQIVVAKEIEPLDPDAQWEAWQTRMQPLLDQENALDKS